MTPTRLDAIRKALTEATPTGWRGRLTTRGDKRSVGTVVFTLTEAPTDLLALDAYAYGQGPNLRGYVKVCPTAYEREFNADAAAVVAIWRALHTGNTVDFDRHGDRTKDAHFVELWFGTPRKPFAVQSK